MWSSLTTPTLLLCPRVFAEWVWLSRSGSLCLLIILAASVGVASLLQRELYLCTLISYKYIASNGYSSIVCLGRALGCTEIASTAHASVFLGVTIYGAVDGPGERTIYGFCTLSNTFLRLYYLLEIKRPYVWRLQSRSPMDTCHPEASSV